MKKLTLTMLGTVLLFSTAVQAQEQTIKGYASVKAVVTKTDSNFWGNKKKFDPKGANIAVGVKATQNLRFEVEYNHREKADKTWYFSEIIPLAAYGERNEKMELSIQSYMLNGYFDFHNTSKFTPYIGIGFGQAKVEYDYTDNWAVYNYNTGVLVADGLDTYHASKTKFAYNISAGTSYDLNDHLALDLGLRYVDYGSFSDADGDKYKTKSKEVSFGVRYSF